MNLTDKRFWIAWLLLLILAIVSCMTEGWCEDGALLGAAYALSLLSTWLWVTKVLKGFRHSGL